MDDALTEGTEQNIDDQLRDKVEHQQTGENVHDHITAKGACPNRQNITEEG